MLRAKYIFTIKGDNLVQHCINLELSFRIFSAEVVVKQREVSSCKNHKIARRYVSYEGLTT